MSEQSDIYSRHAHFLEQFKNGEVKKFLPFLNRVARSLRSELLKTQTVNSKARIKAKLNFVESLVLTEFGAFADQLSEQLDLLAVNEGEFSADTLGKLKAVETVLPSAAQLIAAVKARPFNNKILKDYLKDFSRDQARQIRNAVSTGFFEGKTTPQIIKEVVGTVSARYNDGLLKQTRASAERIVRTAVNHTSSVARDLTQQENSDIAPYYEWVSTLDGRTSNICKKLDGTVYRVGKGRLPPAHFNCRSTTAPLFADEVSRADGELTKKDIGGKRASKDGQVSANLTYGEWLEKQSKKFQVEALGEARAKLFRDGGLTLDKFVNDADQTLTLDQLKSKYPTAWDKADL